MFLLAVSSYAIFLLISAMQSTRENVSTSITKSPRYDDSGTERLLLRRLGVVVRTSTTI